MLGPHHLMAKRGDIAEKVVVSGDPARVVQLSGLLKHRKLVNENRGFLTYTGDYEGTALTVSCHGVGAPSVAIVVEELTMLGAKIIVRLGSCGGMLETMKIGDLVIATSARYRNGTLDCYFGRKVTPKPDGALTRLLADSIRGEGVKYYEGPVFSTDAFYSEDPHFVDNSRKRGYVAVEMECATLFGLGMLRGVRTAAILVVSDLIVETAPMVNAKVLSEYVARAGRAIFRGLRQLQV
jgi:5'-methylthioadenosine phosphorylase